MKIGFVGMGKLGLPCALAIESRGHEVKGYDINPEIKKSIENKKIPYLEEGVEDLLKVTDIEIYDDLADLLIWSDIVFVAVQTPHDPFYEGITRLPEKRIDFDYSHLKKAIKNIAILTRLLGEDVNLNKGKKRFVVSIISTVLPGTMYNEIFPLIPKGQTNLSIVYNPFFIAMGTTVRDFLYPEFVLLGVDDPIAADLVEGFYNSTLPNGWQDPPFIKTPIFRCSIITAETIKVLYNTYITGKICFANAAMELCEKTGANVDHVIDALSLGNRRIISSSYMRAGMGDGGGCHPRDNIALSYIARKLNISYDWWENLMIAREKQTEWLSELIIKYKSDPEFIDSDIYVLGYTFKPETNLTVGSPALLLSNMLLEEGYRPILWDPYIDKTVIYDSGKLPADDTALYHLLTGKAIYFIGTKHEIFSRFIFPAGSIVIDPFRYIPDMDMVIVKRIGEGNA